MAAIVSLQIFPSIDGRLRYGDAPEPTADVTAAQNVPNDLDNLVGVSFSLDGGDYFSGDDVGSGTISFIATTGSLAGVGLSFAADVISGATPISGTVTGRFRWTSSFDPDDFRETNEFALSFVAGATEDTTPPTRVIGVTAQRSGGNVTLEHLPSSDPHDGASPGSGIDHYDVLVGETIVHTASSVAAEPSPEWLSMDVGDLPIFSESTRSGSGGSIRSSGYIGENSEQNKGHDRFHAAALAQISGDFRLSVQALDITQGSASPSLKFGPMLRYSLAPGAPFVFGQLRAGYTQRLEYRPIPDLNRATLGTGAIDAGGFAVLERIGSTVNYYTGRTGNDLALVATITLDDMPDTVYVMLALCGTSDTGAAEATYDNLSLTQGGKITHTFASASGGPFVVRAVDAAENVGDVSAPVPVTAAPNIPVRYHPGVAFWLRASKSLSSMTSAFNARVLPNANLPMCAFSRLWGMVETNNGVYDWSVLDGISALCQANGKRWWFWPSYTNFNASPNPLVVPADLRNSSGYIVNPGASTLAKVYLAPIRARWLNFLRQIATRYVIDSSFMGFQMPETAYGITTSISADFSQSGLQQTYEDAVKMLRAEFPELNTHVCINFKLNITQIAELAVSVKAAIGHPDTRPYWPSAIAVGGNQYLERLYQGQVPIAPNIQFGNYAYTSTYPADHPLYPNETHNGLTAFELIHYCWYYLGAQYIFWDNLGSDGDHFDEGLAAINQFVAANQFPVPL